MPCLTCSAPLPVSRHQRRFCPACLRQRKLERVRAYYHKTHPTPRPAGHPTTPDLPDAEIERRIDGYLAARGYAGAKTRSEAL